MKSILSSVACVLLLSSCAGAESDVSAVTFNSSLPQGAIRVEKGFLPGRPSALAWFPSAQPKAALLINPGAQIPAAAMADMGAAGAAAGYATYIIENAANLPILPGNSDNIGEVAEILAKDPAQFKNLPKAMRIAHETGLKIYAIGHSMGGAVLTADIERTNSPLSGIILLGVSKLVAKPKSVQVPLTFAFGENDKVTSQPEIKVLAKELSANTIKIEGVNHFCIVSDAKVGAAEFRARDGLALAGLNARNCADRVISTLNAAKILP